MLPGRRQHVWALLGIEPRSDGRALVVSARSLAEALARAKQQLEFS
jgi:hypothetical protein